MKYKTISIHVFGTVILAMLSSCRYFEEMLEEDGFVGIYNATGDTICTYEATGYYKFTPTTYPDTLLPHDKEYINGETISERIYLNQLFPYSKGYTYPIFDKKSRPFFSLPKDTLSIFFISKDTLSKYGYDKVRDSNLIIARYDLSMEEIKRLYKKNESIIFPRDAKGNNNQR